MPELKQIREGLRRKCVGCEFFGIKLNKEPWFKPCQLREQNIEDCMFLQSALFLLTDIGDIDKWKSLI